MQDILFVVTTEILNPDNLEVLIPAGGTITPEQLAAYNHKYGIDSIPCVVCVGEWVAAKIRVSLEDTHA